MIYDEMTWEATQAGEQAFYKGMVSELAQKSRIRHSHKSRVQ
jgi:hypothetical protein